MKPASQTFVDTLWVAVADAQTWDEALAEALRAVPEAAVEVLAWRQDNMGIDDLLAAGTITERAALQTRLQSDDALGAALELHGLPPLRDLCVAAKAAFEHRDKPEAAAEIGRLEALFIEEP